MASVRDILGPQGRIAKRLPGYETRPEQLAMAEAVEQAIANRQKLMVEAGTGVGKSFAYLVPALLAATGNTRKKIVVSTNTISLQEQIIQKDIPFLRSIWPDEFSAVLVKGRSNYVSRRRALVAERKAASTLFDDDSQNQLADILQWMEITTDGSRSDLRYSPLPIVWDQVQSEHGNCLGKSCPEYMDCFYYKARKRVWNADLLVVNHSLFFSDLALRQQDVSILPNYDIVIFDEAHTLEDAGAGHIGMQLTSSQFDYALTRLYNDRTNKGLLVHHDFPDLRQLCKQVQFQVGDFFDAIINWQQRFGSKNGRVRSKNIVPNTITDPMKSFARQLSERAEQINKETERVEVVAAANRCRALADEVDSWLEQDLEQGVYWIEMGHRGRVTLACSPVEVGDLFRAQLWRRVPTAIVTSATLQTGKSVDGDGFHFFRKRLGLQECQTLAQGSPYDYRKQAHLHLMTHMPDPGLNPKEFENATLRLIPEYVELTQGHTFVLFTSHRALKTASDRLADWMALHRYPLFSQSDGMPRSQMLAEFKKTPRSVLFGTSSFWQGVDVQGEALQCVIITRLPFSVPERPLIEARVEAIRNRGEDPFMEYSLPEAILKFKQGFGRLIRTKQDHGHVVILDPRILTKRYGQNFLRSLPDCPRTIRNFQTGHREVHGA